MQRMSFEIDVPKQNEFCFTNFLRNCKLHPKGCELTIHGNGVKQHQLKIKIGKVVIHQIFGEPAIVSYFKMLTKKASR